MHMIKNCYATFWKNCVRRFIQIVISTCGHGTRSVYLQEGPFMNVWTLGDAWSESTICFENFLELQPWSTFLMGFNLHQCNIIFRVQLETLLHSDLVRCAWRHAKNFLYKIIYKHQMRHWWVTLVSQQSITNNIFFRVHTKTGMR